MPLHFHSRVIDAFPHAGRLGGPFDDHCRPPSPPPSAPCPKGSRRKATDRGIPVVALHRSTERAGS
ncbi:hypothetical protein [Streptomyces sp. NPDC053431]|uniref:hypothetical protein n=1 Tax=Streptomyces sp. NPDC053431 TaxID=3365703 RepID=UPI0037D2ACBA